MTECKRLIPAGLLLATLLLATLLLAAPTALAQPSETEESQQGKNVVIHFRMGTFDGKKRTVSKSYTLVIAAGSLGSQLLTGQRVPFAGGPDGSVVYQNIGFVTDAKAWVLDDDKVKLMADIEDSRIRESDDDSMPIVETRQLTVNAILTDGEPLELTRAEGLTDLSGYVEVEARIQK